jgi:pyruvate kinase
MAGCAEVVMLNKGPRLAAGVAALDRLLQRMGEHQVKKQPTLRADSATRSGREPCL